MSNDIEQRIETALGLLKPQADGCGCDPDVDWICEPCFIHGVICDMKREREILKKQRDVAIRHLAQWCDAISTYGAWDEWNQYYKDARFNDHALPEIRDLLNQAIKTATKECQT